MNLFKVLQTVLSLGTAVRGARDGMVAAGQPVPEVLNKAAGKFDVLEAILAEGAGTPGLDAYDKFLDETANMGAGIFVCRRLADGALDTDPATGEPVGVEVPALATKLLDKAMDAVRKDPV